MPSVASLLDAINERTIAQRIGIPHDQARMRYALPANTVDDFEAFTRVIADYYNYHFTTCVSNGGSLSAAEAAGVTTLVRFFGSALAGELPAAPALRTALRRLRTLLARL